MEGLLKTYATRLARKHVLKKVGAAGVSVLETEEQLLEMALSRLREELLGMEKRPEDDIVVQMVRQETVILIERYAEDEAVLAAALADVRALSDDDILPKLH